MKKLMLIVSLLFTINLSAVQDWGNVSAKTSMCYYQGYSWNRYTLPQANTCYNIRGVQSHFTGWEDTYNKSRTSKDHAGYYMLVAVDVFGVPSDKPTCNV
jgi:hypothetical protein